MTQPTYNILPFPISPRLLTMKVPTASERVTETVAVASISEHTVTAEDRAAHAASVVGTTISFARRKGIRLDSLPPQLRTWLLDLCDQGDPTCRMVRDWLTGNRRYCTPMSREDA